MNNIIFCTDKNLVNLIPNIFTTFLKYNNPLNYTFNFILFNECEYLNKQMENIINQFNEIKINFRYFIPSNKLIKILNEYEKLIQNNKHKITDVFCNLSNWSRFYINKIYPEIDFGLYLDMDILFSGNIDKIFNINLKEYVLGAVPYELKCIQNNFFVINNRIKRKIFKKFSIQELLLKNNSYNCGVILFNLKLFQENNILHKIIKFLNYCVKNNVLIFKSGTERPLNFFVSDYYKLSQKYNYIISKCIDINKTKNDLNKTSIIHFKGYRNLIQNNTYKLILKNILN